MKTVFTIFSCIFFWPILTKIAVCRGNFMKISDAEFHEDRFPVGAQFLHSADGQTWRTVIAASQTRSHSRGKRLLPSSCPSVCRHALARWTDFCQIGYLGRLKKQIKSKYAYIRAKSRCLRVKCCPAVRVAEEGINITRTPYSITLYVSCLCLLQVFCERA